jgi:dGTPase
MSRIIFFFTVPQFEIKVQVIRLSQNWFCSCDTHSLEVSVVGRSLGRMAGQKYSSGIRLVELGYKTSGLWSYGHSSTHMTSVIHPFGLSGERPSGICQ